MAIRKRIRTFPLIRFLRNSVVVSQRRPFVYLPPGNPPKPSSISSNNSVDRIKTISLLSCQHYLYAFLFHPDLCRWRDAQSISTIYHHPSALPLHLFQKAS